MEADDFETVVGSDVPMSHSEGSTEPSTVDILTLHLTSARTNFRQ
jgi:hypothetical protein